jgi:hypothetical protein
MPRAMLLAALTVLLASGLVRMSLQRRFPILALSSQSAFISYTVAALAVTWLALSSTLLLWVVPVSLLLSLAVGYFAAKLLLRRVALTELRVTLVVVVLSALSVAAAVVLTADPAFRYIAGSYMLVNIALFVVSAFATLRKVPRAG